MVLLHFRVGASLDVIPKQALRDPDDYCLLSKVNLPQGQAPRCPHGWLRTSLVHPDTPIMIRWTLRCTGNQSATKITHLSIFWPEGA